MILPTVWYNFFHLIQNCVFHTRFLSFFSSAFLSFKYEVYPIHQTLIVRVKDVLALTYIRIPLIVVSLKCGRTVATSRHIHSDHIQTSYSLKTITSSVDLGENKGVFFFLGYEKEY